MTRLILKTAPLLLAQGRHTVSVKLCARSVWVMFGR